eukprot:TRINITY_DN4713_c0_g2_i1.p1 TRINITY_DN4713_c0_g2~~TRINITY_DN4713_c0_g2_i1.p1  ORF type:complete len:242 (+),score=-12.62 TRINITY_DN4713_c0_g2_i1:291-1016(+)
MHRKYHEATCLKYIISNFRQPPYPKFQFLCISQKLYNLTYKTKAASQVNINIKNSVIIAKKTMIIYLTTYLHSQVSRYYPNAPFLTSVQNLTKRYYIYKYIYITLQYLANGFEFLLSWYQVSYKILIDVEHIQNYCRVLTRQNESRYSTIQFICVKNVNKFGTTNPNVGFSKMNLDLQVTSIQKSQFIEQTRNLKKSILEQTRNLKHKNKQENIYQSQTNKRNIINLVFNLNTLSLVDFQG